jgi:ABC-type nitrate/sulfonate/bicarbonate transport system permease component
LRTYLEGLCLSIVVGVLAGTVMARSRLIDGLLAPVVEFFRPMPSAAVIPLAIVFLGVGSEMKVFVATYGATWPVLINTLYGVRATHPRILEVARLFRLSRFRTLGLILLPSAAPYIWTGIKLGSILTLGLVVTAELIASGDGIGYLIQTQQLSFRVPETFAGVFAVMGLGLLANTVLLVLERRTLAWHVSDPTKERP